MKVFMIFSRELERLETTPIPAQCKNGATRGLGLKDVCQWSQTPNGHGPIKRLELGQRPLYLLLDDTR